MAISAQLLEEMTKRRQKLLVGGGEDKIKARHKKGLMSARERLAALFQENTFQEIGVHAHHSARHFGMDKRICRAMA